MTTTLAVAGPRFAPAELADLLGMRTRPTREQADVIAAPASDPLLVVAGAGSGKTETMAARVVWLVANDYVQPEQVLGLTFTRKAAGELASRIRQRLAQLARKLGTPESSTGEPTVATYHSYAARIVAEHGVRAGFEPTARLLTEASCWQLADAVVRSYTGDMSDVEYAPSTVTEAVMHLAAELAEHLRTPDDLAAWTGRFYAETGAPAGKMYAPVTKVRSLQQARLALLPMVREYARRKRELESMDFGDQLARAAAVANGHIETGVIERDRFRVVLLDEYQDTSHAQVSLLRALFGGGHPVTAVGDPCQSIYGWRGASAGTLDRFAEEFGDRRGRPAAELTLSTSWRNRPEILHVANALSAPLREHGHHVTELVASPHADEPAGASTVHCALVETFADEATWIAARILAAWRHRAGIPDADPEHLPVESRPSTAVLVRTRKQIAPIEVALRAAGLPVEVVGLGGLLDTPEVRDVVSTLRVLADPLAGAALLRLLTGPRWRIGPRDLVALYRRARSLSDSRRAGTRNAETDADAAPLVPGRLDEAALVDALDDLGHAERYSPEGYRRFAAYAAELRRLRTRLDQPLPDLIEDIEREMGLDVEVAIRAADTGLARAHLDAFAETAARFESDTQGATLSAFLAYLAAAELEERGLRVGEVDVVEGAVQILTVHAAKGLEWDVVAVAGLSKDQFPEPTKASDHYLGGLGMLPFPLRGDRAGLPRLESANLTAQVDVRNALAAFTDDWRAHGEREERRLAYVAVTRARQLLLCSGFWWGDGLAKPRGASVFLDEIRQVCQTGAGQVDEWEPAPAADATNPTRENVLQAVWPQDPLGERRAAIEEAAALVRAAPADDAEDDQEQRWVYEVDLLLAERARTRPRDDDTVEVALPAQLSVSQLVALRHDPAALAGRLRRPMPRRPDPQARRGTAFHRWLEQRFGTDQLLDLDELPGAGDEGAAPDDHLAELQATFLASEWADRMPAHVEVPFATVVDGVVIRGRMDAVFADDDGSFDVVDWKTGRRPSGRAAAEAAIQLGAYRLGWAHLAAVPVERVRAAFYYVNDDVTVRPVDLIDASGLVALIADLPTASPDETGGPDSGAAV
jgi:DNA helicase-2/ATP-dependent DNA helicase PcrA